MPRNYKVCSQNAKVCCWCTWYSVIAQLVLWRARGWAIQGLNPGRGIIFGTCPNQPWIQPSPLYNGDWVSFPGAKWPVCGIDHPPPSSAEVTESRAIPLPPLWVFLAFSRVNIANCWHLFITSHFHFSSQYVCLQMQNNIIKAHNSFAGKAKHQKGDVYSSITRVLFRKNCAWRKNSKHYSHTGAKNVIEAYFENETTILRERQLVPFA